MNYEAYRFITSVVSPYISADKILKQIEVSLLNWELIAGMAGVHSIVQALYPALIEKKVAEFIPKDFSNYIEHLSELNKKRNLMLQSQLMDAVLVMNNLGVKPMLIKGAAHLFLDTFSKISDRLLVDLDVLVPSSEIENTKDELIRSGYEYSGDEMQFIDTHHHYPPLIKKNECAMLELHRDLMFRDQQRIFPTLHAWSNTIDITLPNNAKAKVLNPTYRVFHSFLHSNVTDSLYQKGIVEIRQLHELARSYLVYGTSIDWDEMFEYAYEHGVGKQLNANLYLANKFMAVPCIKSDNINNNTISSKLNYYRVKSKFKYDWFNTFDQRLYRLKKRILSKIN